MTEGGEVHSERLVIKARLGLHARATAYVGRIANLFPRHQIHLRNMDRDEFADARNVLDVLLQSVPSGGEVEIRVAGPRARHVCIALKELLEHGLPHFESGQSLLDLRGLDQDWGFDPEPLVRTFLQKSGPDLMLCLEKIGLEKLVDDLSAYLPRTVSREWREQFRARITGLLLAAKERLTQLE